MPTSYTDPVNTGTINTLADYARLCASHRVKPVPDGTSVAFIHEQLEAARVICDEVLTDEQCDVYNETEFVIAMNDHYQALERWEKIEARYDAMYVDVMDWTPPTAEHEALKEFMLKELSDALDVFETGQPPTKMSGSAWFETRLLAATADYKRLMGELESAVTAIADEAEWHRALEASL